MALLAVSVRSLGKRAAGLTHATSVRSVAQHARQGEATCLRLDPRAKQLLAASSTLYKSAWRLGSTHARTTEHLISNIHFIMASIENGAGLFATKISMTLELAKKLANAAREEAQRNSWNVVVSILDDGANLVYLERMDGTQVGSVQVSQDKGATAVKFKRPSKAFEDMILGGKVNVSKLTGALPMEGGLPLIIDGQIIGAIGVSGVTSAQDGVVAQAGVEELHRLYKLQASAP